LFVCVPKGGSCPGCPAPPRQGRGGWGPLGAVASCVGLSSGWRWPVCSVPDRGQRGQRRDGVRAISRIARSDHVTSTGFSPAQVGREAPLRAPGAAAPEQPSALRGRRGGGKHAWRCRARPDQRSVYGGGELVAWFRTWASMTVQLAMTRPTGMSRARGGRSPAAGTRAGAVSGGAGPCAPTGTDDAERPGPNGVTAARRYSAGTRGPACCPAGPSGLADRSRGRHDPGHAAAIVLRSPPVIFGSAHPLTHVTNRPPG